MKYILWIVILCIPLTFCRRGINDMPGYTVIIPDSVSSNDSVPDIYTVSSSFKRLVVTRFKHGTDMLDGLKKTVISEGIKNAVITSGIGSVYRYHIHSVDNDTFPAINVFVKKDDPMDILSVNGYVLNERVHAHISLSNEEYAIGGHLEPDTRIFTFCIITLGVLEDDLLLERFDDTTLR